MIKITAEEPPLPDDVVDGAIRLADIHASDRVTIIGRGHLDLLLGLNRRGILSAGCEQAECGPQSTDDVDVVWVPDAVAPTAFLTALTRCGRHLRPGGAVIVGPDLPSSGADGSWLRRLLFERGFTSVAQIQLGDVEAGALLCARKHCAAVGKAA